MEEDGQNDWDKVLASACADLAESLEKLDRPTEAASAMGKARELKWDDESDLE